MTLIYSVIIHRTKAVSTVAHSHYHQLRYEITCFKNTIFG